jgi:hypothetical protein
MSEKTIIKRYALFHIKKRKLLDATFKTYYEATQSPLYRHYGEDYKILAVDLHLELPS